MAPPQLVPLGYLFCCYWLATLCTLSIKGAGLRAVVEVLLNACCVERIYSHPEAAIQHIKQIDCCAGIFSNLGPIYCKFMLGLLLLVFLFLGVLLSEAVSDCFFI